MNASAPLNTSPVGSCSRHAAANEPVSVSVFVAVVRLNRAPFDIATWPIETTAGPAAIPPTVPGGA